MNLISLVYLSFSAHDMSDDDLINILEIARRNNQDLDVTGMLLYREGFFIQALEGEEEKVMAIYDKIKRDNRHKNLLILHKEPIKKRSFEEWSMGFNKIDDETAASLEGFTDYLTRPIESEYFTMRPDRALLLLESFKKRVRF